MKQLAILGLALALLAGCSTPQMKPTPFYEGSDRDVYTGAAEDRVNLWPVAYWREPVGSIAWPVLSFSDDQLALRPLYSQYKQEGKSGGWDEFNLCWPLVQADLRDHDYRVFPAFWGGTTNSSYQTLFPVWFNGRRKGDEQGWNALFPLWIAKWNADETSLKTLGGLAGERTRKDGYSSNWCFPLWYWNSTGLFATPLYGRTPESYWFFPLWYRDTDTFVSLPVSWTGNGKDGGWASPGLLSWGGWEEDGSWKAKLLLGILGAEHYVTVFEREAGDGARKTVEPDVYTNLCDEVWCGPLWERKDWLCKGARSARREFLLGCCAWEWDEAGLESAHVFPLFSWNRSGTFYTPLGGRIVNTNDCRTTTLYTVLAGTQEGLLSTGGWVFPFWKHEKRVGFDSLAARLDAPRLPDDIKVWIKESTNGTGKVSYFRKGDSFHASDETTWFLLSDDDRQVRGGPDWAWHVDDRPAATNDYWMTWQRKRGNVLVFNVKERRDAEFSSCTREKVKDEEFDKTSLLVWLYESDGTRDRLTGDVYRHRRMLWRLWDWERTNGDVSLDIFPGFTYDAKADGFVKTSLLWRLFRYENDPKTGVSADFLFLPIWRP